MNSNTSAVQLEKQQGIMASIALKQDIEPANRTSAPFNISIKSPSFSREDFNTLSASYSFNSLLPKAAPVTPTQTDQRFQAKFVFPAFNYTLSARLVSSLTSTRDLILNFEIDEGVSLLWQTSGGPTFNGEKVRFEEATVGVNVTSHRPHAHFIASSLQTLFLLDSSATVEVSKPQFHADIHFEDSLNTAGEFLRRRQLAYRLMVIERAFNQELAIPSYISRSDRETIDFVYRALTERSFVWPFWQEEYDFSANEQANRLLAKIDGTFAFLIEIGCLKQEVLNRTLDLGEVKITVQNTALVSPKEVAGELKHLDGHDFQVIIKSLSGSANYEFLEAPQLPDSPWDEPIEQLVNLENKLDDQFFVSVNQLAASSIDEETALEQEALLTKLSFDFSEDGNSIPASN